MKPSLEKRENCEFKGFFEMCCSPDEINRCCDVEVCKNFKVKKLKQAPVTKRVGSERGRPVCDCTHTQACEDCAESKGIDWSIIKDR